MKEIEYKVALKKMGIDFKNIYCDDYGYDTYYYKDLNISNGNIQGYIPTEVLKKYSKSCNFDIDYDKDFNNLLLGFEECVNLDSKDDFLNFLSDINSYYSNEKFKKNNEACKKLIGERLKKLDIRQGNVINEFRSSLNAFDESVVPYFSMESIPSKVTNNISYDYSGDAISISINEKENNTILNFVLYRGGYLYSVSYDKDEKRCILEHYYYDGKEKVQYEEKKGRNVKVNNYDLTQNTMSSSEKLGYKNVISDNDYVFMLSKLEEGKNKALSVTCDTNTNSKTLVKRGK